MTLEGKVALVTGSAKRVGRSIALELARAGCDVAVHFLNSRDDAQQTANNIRHMGRKCEIIGGDLNNPSDWPRIIKRCIESFGRLDVLVNNASIFHAEGGDTIEQFDPALWDRTLRINLTAIAGLIHHATSFLSTSGEGCIINLADATVDRPFANHLAYSASKAGVVSLTKALARRLAPNVRVNAVAPGIAAFPDSYDAQLREELVNRVPLKRESSPEDVASLVRYLAEQGNYITGAVIPVDGGRSIV